MVGKDVLATPNMKENIDRCWTTSRDTAGVVNLILIIASSLTINL